MNQKAKYFDCHFHIIDKNFPVVPNQGFMPDAFTSEDYLDRLKAVDLCGGAVVSGSFQAFDQSYLFHALKVLGPTFVGVTQVPQTISDQELKELNSAGVRAVRFNVKRGGSEEIHHLESLARRVHELVGWHTELYVDSAELADLYETLISLPAVSIDHQSRHARRNSKSCSFHASRTGRRVSGHRASVMERPLSGGMSTLATR